MPRRDSLGAATICSTGAASARGAFSDRAGRQKVHGIVRILIILRMGPTSSKVPVSIRHGRGWTPHKNHAMRNLKPFGDSFAICTKLGPTETQHAAQHTKKKTWENTCFADFGLGRPCPSPLITCIFAAISNVGFDGGSCKAMFPTLALSSASVTGAPTQDQVAYVKPS